MARLDDVPFPEVQERIDSPPETTAEEYDSRLSRVANRLDDEGVDVLVVYGDREHAGDMAYLCGVDPRFEEALLIIFADGSRHIILGNECYRGYYPNPDLGIIKHLYQEFSLQGQRRDCPTKLEDLLEKIGIERGLRVGTAGGKYLSERYVTSSGLRHTIPSFVVDVLRAICGAESVVNLETLFLDPSTGIRVTADAKEIVQCEYSAYLTSLSIVRALTAMHPGTRECDIANAFVDLGIPRSVHAMVSFGDKVWRGLSSPTARSCAMGDAYHVAFGVRYALTCRAGAIAEDQSQLYAGSAASFEELTRNYYDVLVAWYEALDIGVTGSAVYLAADNARDPECFEFLVNPGHLLHFEEWSNSIFWPTEDATLRSGMLLQGDIIPVPLKCPYPANAEDGVALADAELRRRLETEYPAFYARVMRRRELIRNYFGVELADSVLPLSDTCLWYSPFALSLRRAMVKG